MHQEGKGEKLEKSRWEVGEEVGVVGPGNMLISNPISQSEAARQHYFDNESYISLYVYLIGVPALMGPTLLPLNVYVRRR
jgi:hypothetical protein